LALKYSAELETVTATSNAVSAAAATDLHCFWRPSKDRNFLTAFVCSTNFLEI
jgi:hypothetical protein